MTPYTPTPRTTPVIQPLEYPDPAWIVALRLVANIAAVLVLFVLLPLSIYFYTTRAGTPPRRRRSWAIHQHARGQSPG